MADVFTQNKRSEIMSKIRSRDTKPEILIRKFLHANGYRYRVNVRNMPGHPDIVLPRYKSIIFVHGCFWHGHEDTNCRFSRIPKTNILYWSNKIKNNQIRHFKNVIKLQKLGWYVLTVWECKLRGANKHILLKEIANKISANLNSKSSIG